MLENSPLSEQWYEAASKWAELEGAATMLEETKSAVLAQYMSRCGDVAVSKAEMQVKASPQWEDHVKKIVKARTAANQAKVQMEFLKMKFWEWQSSSATERTMARF